MIHDSFRIIDMSGGILNLCPPIRYILPEKSGYKPLLNTLRPLWEFLQVKNMSIHFEFYLTPNFLEYNR